MFVYDSGNALSVPQSRTKLKRELLTFSFFHFLFRLEIRATYKSLDLTVYLDG